MKKNINNNIFLLKVAERYRSVEQDRKIYIDHILDKYFESHSWLVCHILYPS